MPGRPAGPPLLSRSTVDRDAGRRGDPEALRAAWEAEGRLLRLRVRRGVGLVAPATPDGGGLDLPPTGGLPFDPQAYYLGRDAEAFYFAVVETGPVAAEAALTEPHVDLRSAGASLSARDAGLLTHAVALAEWRATHLHCPRCGAATDLVPGGHSAHCPVDGRDQFPRTDPAVIMLVTTTDGERALLGRQASWPLGRYSCLAGFVEAGESAEQAVVREVAEEAGIRGLRAVRPLATQPWPFPASLMLGYRAEADEAPPAPEDAELVDVSWYARDAVRAGIADGSMVLPPQVSIARMIIDGWLGEDGGEVPADPGIHRFA